MTANEGEAIDSLIGDWRERFNGGLYWIKPADDRPECLFVPRPEQWVILELIYEAGNTKLGILKSRQLGFSTLLSLIMMDFMLWRPGSKLCLVDQNRDTAEKKLEEKIKFAWEHLPPDLRSVYEISPDNNSEFGIRIKPEADLTEEQMDVVRQIYAGMNPRGSTLDFLWVSEWGPIQVEDAQRSDKIADGGLPAAEKGLTVIETTWRGGQTGRLWTEVVEQALQIKDTDRTIKDWLILFFPWYLDPELRFEGNVGQINAECRYYLDTVEDKAIAEAKEMDFEFDGFDDEQRLWYFKVAWPKRFKRYEEYPTIRSEMFLSPQPGAIYPDEVADLRNSGRLCRVPIISSHKVFVSFDLGRSDYMPLCFIQWVGTEVRVVDYYCNNREVVPHYCNVVKKWCLEHGIMQVDIVLPHDSRNERIEAQDSIFTQFEKAGKGSGLEWSVFTVDACASVWDGIDCVREVFPFLIIDSDRCDKAIKKAKGHEEFPGLIECLTQYHSKQTNDGQSITLDVIHDRFCHGADSLRTFCEGLVKGILLRTGQSITKPTMRSGHGRMDSGSRKQVARRRIRKPKLRA